MNLLDSAQIHAGPVESDRFEAVLPSHRKRIAKIIVDYLRQLCRSLLKIEPGAERLSGNVFCRETMDRSIIPFSFDIIS
jgi:hypothetical protein